MSIYRKSISRITEQDPRHVEGLMLVKYGTLDSLTATQFRREVNLCAEAARLDPVLAEDIAKSYCL